MRYPIETPYSRNNGEYQFISYYTGSGAAAFIHLSKEEIIYRVEKIFGPGELIDDDKNLYWETTEVAQPLYDVGL